MPSSHSLAGLMQWLARDPWREAFADVVEQHIGRAISHTDIADLEELG